MLTFTKKILPNHKEFIKRNIRNDLNRVPVKNPYISNVRDPQYQSINKNEIKLKHDWLIFVMLNQQLPYSYLIT